MVTPTDINNLKCNKLTDSLLLSNFWLFRTSLHNHETDWSIIGCYAWTNAEKYNQEAVKLLYLNNMTTSARMHERVTLFVSSVCLFVADLDLETA